MKEKLHQLLRVAKFERWENWRLEIEILQLFGLEGVDDQPAPPDQ